jgi:hypothetical protein
MKNYVYLGFALSLDERKEVTEPVGLGNIRVRGSSARVRKKRKEWLRGLDSNQDNQLQRLACYQLHYPGIF